MFASQLGGAATPLVAAYDAAVADAKLRGQFPVGVFAEAARTIDLAMLETWRAGVGLMTAGSATRFGFGRASSDGAQLRPALTLELSGGRTLRITGQTELLLVQGGDVTSIVTLVGELANKSKYHLRGAFDHLVLAAAGMTPGRFTHKLIDPDGNVCEVEHTPWTTADARGYLTALATELLDGTHGYLLPFEAIVKALGGGKPNVKYSERANHLGFGPIERQDGLDLPADAVAIARRRLLPLVERMRGNEHGFEVAT